MEVAGWKHATTNEQHPEVPVLFFFSDGVYTYERQLVSLLVFYRTLTMSFSDVQNNNT